MKNKVNKIWTLILSVMTLFAVASCSEEKSQKKAEISIESNETASQPLEKTEITLGVLNELSSELPAAVNEFNRNNDKYKVVIRDYSEGKALEEMDETELSNAMMSFDMDIINGNSPDIIAGRIFDISSYIMGDVFADLYNCMDSYGGMVREDLLPNVAEATELNGKLPVIMTNFMVESSTAKAKHIPEEYSDWSIDDVFGMLEVLPEDMSLFFGETSVNAMASYILGGCESDFVDYGKGTCSFDSPEFIELLERIASLDFDTYAQVDTDGMSVMRDKVLINDISLNSVSQAVYAMYCDNGEEMIFLGKPFVDGGKPLVSAEELIGISAVSSQQEGAWEFISFLLKESQLPMDLEKRGMGIPVTEAHFRALIDAEGEGSIREPQAFFWMDGEEIALSEEKIIEYEEFIRSAGGSIYKNMNISNIIWTEVQSLLGGECSAERCAEIIQNRVSIYLSEQS